MDNSAPLRPIVTRFAPSPTGFLHIGGARTALFNWLYARHYGGTYLLRIEDTDRARSTRKAIKAIIDGLSWLGIDADQEPIFQSARAERHRELVKKLLAEGHAYRCYCTPEELEEMRRNAESEGRQPTYDGRWRDRGFEDAPPDIEPVIRLKVSRTGETRISDKVQGDVVIQNKFLDDLVILRSNGTPTYNFAVVADDYDMGVTHVIRGVDHLINAARQMAIYKALDWEIPEFAHIPLIHGTDGTKLSKRHGALGIEAYQAMGYLPEALRNYIVRLGWSHGDGEIFSTEEMIKYFDIKGLGKSSARFDFKKLADINSNYMRHTEDSKLISCVKTLLSMLEGGAEKEKKFAALGWDKFITILPALKERSTTLVELIEAGNFLILDRPIQLNENASKALTNETRQHLSRVSKALFHLEDWSVDAIETAVREFVKTEGLKLGKVGPAIRAALTGTTVSLPLFYMLAALGRDEALGRIDEQSV
ncbi:MAG: Glutamate--tRNA ligase [Hyphomicrobiaceae bacterium hypho_1]